LAARELDERRQVAQAQPRKHGYLLADGRDRHRSIRAVHEVHVERRLELANGDTERGLRHEALRGRAPKVLLLGQSDEVAQLFERREVRCGFLNGCMLEPWISR
jgi:hypothetical protein